MVGKFYEVYNDYDACDNFYQRGEGKSIEMYIFSNKLLYYLFAADKIQISKTTWLMLSMKGGYIMEERGVIEIKVI